MSSTYILRSKLNPNLVLCADGEWRWDRLCAPGGYKIKIFKTLAGADRKASIRGDFIREVRAGLEVTSSAERVDAIVLV